MTTGVGARPVFTIAISKGSGLVRESRLLLDAYTPGEPLEDFISRVSRQDLLGRVTAQRTRDIIRRVFVKRFLGPPSAPAVHLKRLLTARPYGRWFPELCLLYAARADDTLRGVVVDLYGQVVRNGGIFLGVASVEAYLRQAESDGLMSQSWSTEVRRKVARGLLQAMQEFGLLTEVRRGNREISLPDPHPVTVAYLAYDLHDRGLTDADVVGDRDWRLWALSDADIRSRMDALTPSGLWIFQAAAAVVRITWTHPSIDEAIDDIARLDVR